MESNEIAFWLRNERFTVSPLKCTKHLWAHQGWDFLDNKYCCGLKAIHRCIYCGKIGYAMREYKAIGPNSFDLEDEKLIRSGVLGHHWIDRKVKEDMKKL